MKIAVLADIHANLAALHAVVADIEAWAPDRVIVAGDTVNRGPQSVECLALVSRLASERGWLLMQGNHEEYLLRYSRDHTRADFPTSGPRFEVMRNIAWTYRQMGGALDQIANLPDRLDLELGAAGLLSVRHASTLHNRDGLLLRQSDADLRERIVAEAAVFCTGHTHMPFVRQLDHTLLVNVGSVGLSFDGDTRAAYARLTHDRQGWHAEIVRLSYDLPAALHAFDSSGLAEGVGDISPIMRRELATGCSLMYDFVNEFHSVILAGELGIGEAVKIFTGRW
jgi:putative phosphoesterase